MRKALFPGSFDPVTIGHVDIVLRGLAIFDEIIVALGENSSKQYMFSLAERMEMLRLTFQHEPRIRISTYDMLTVDFAMEQEAPFLLRGLRDGKDLAYERPLAIINKYLNQNIETVYLVSEGAHSDLSSTLVREVIRYGRHPKKLVPDAALEVIERKGKLG